MPNPSTIAMDEEDRQLEEDTQGAFKGKSTFSDDAAGTSKQSTMRNFLLVRDEDYTGTSGTGVVAEGVEFSNGQVAIHWISQLESVNVYSCAKVLDALHGHQGRTRIQWL